MQRILIAILIGILAAGAYSFWIGRAEAPDDIPQQSEDADIEAYVRENISTLSPEPAVMGGTFYVTDIEAKDGSGTVWYEDGHIALVADFEYATDKYGITVHSFTVRD
jgi:hypothetical protein